MPKAEKTDGAARRRREKAVFRQYLHRFDPVFARQRTFLAERHEMARGFNSPAAWEDHDEFLTALREQYPEAPRSAWCPWIATEDLDPDPELLDEEDGALHGLVLSHRLYDLVHPPPGKTVRYTDATLVDQFNGVQGQGMFRHALAAIPVYPWMQERDLHDAWGEFQRLWKAHRAQLEPSQDKPRRDPRTTKKTAPDTGHPEGCPVWHGLSPRGRYAIILNALHMRGMEGLDVPTIETRLWVEADSHPGRVVQLLERGDRELRTLKA